MSDEYRVQRIEWNDASDAYDITVRHMDDWEPDDVAWIAPDGDVTPFVNLGFDARTPTPGVGPAFRRGRIVGEWNRSV